MLLHIIPLDHTVRLDLKPFSDYSIISQSSGMNFPIHWVSRLSQIVQAFITGLVILGYEHTFYSSGSQRVVWGFPGNPKDQSRNLRGQNNFHNRKNVT